MKLILSLVLVLAVQTFASKCPEPKCNTQKDKETLWSHNDPYKYWQCRPDKDGFWSPIERNCDPSGVKFSFKHQVCVWPEDYEDSCDTDSPIIIDNDNEPTTCGEDIPACNTEYEKNTLYAHDDVKQFWQCKPDPDGYWSPIAMPCAPYTWFCKDLQVCIWPSDWTKEKCGCDGGSSTTVKPPTTPEQTTTEVTEPPPTTPEQTTTEVTEPPPTTPEQTTIEVTEPPPTTPEQTTPEPTTVLV